MAGTSTPAAVAPDTLIDFLGRQGSWFKPYLSQAQPGNILFVSWNGNNVVNHAGVVVLNRGNNVYVDQHSPTQSGEPVLRAGGAGAWQSKDPKLELWLVQAQVR